MNNFILEYWQGIRNGSIVVGKWVYKLYERIVRELDAGTLRFDQKKANNAIRFIERFCHHNKGALAPGRLTLQLWQKAALSLIFGIVDEDGTRHFRECFMLLGRKMGKTLLAAGIMTYMTYADGEYGAEVYCVAPKLDQANLVYSAFTFNVDHEEAFTSRTKRRKNDLFVASTNTTIQKIAFNEKKADGYNPHLTVCDEGSSWPGERGMKQYEVMVSGTGARTQPLTLMITSGGYEDEGIFDDLMKRATAYLMGDSRESRLLPLLYMIDDIQKWDDINELRKSLPGLGVSVSTEYILDQVDSAYTSLSRKTEFITKYCCLKQNSSQAWLTAEAVAGACGEHLSLEDFRGCYCVGGIDLSMTTDLTACCVVIERGGLLYVFSQFFLPSAKIKEAGARDGLPYDLYAQRGLLMPSGENYVDYHDCFNWFRALIEEYEIYPLAVGYDKYGAQYLVQDMTAYGFKMSDVTQGENLTGIINETEGRFNDGCFRLGDNDLMKVHCLDSALKVNAENSRRKLVKLGRQSHIDGMAALLDAMCMRTFFHDEIGDQLKNEG
jgi:phage terminase large subunit-like protein